jgi:TonB family protein
MFDKLKIWLRGDSNWKAEQELDRLGKSDAFLSDAMEGYRAIPEGDHTRSLAELKARLTKRTEKKRGFIYWRGIAAAAAVVGVIGLFFWTQRDLKGPDVLVDVSPINKEEGIQKFAAPSETKEIALGDSSVEEDILNDTIISKSEDITKPLAFNESQIKRSKLKADPSNIEAGIIEAESEEVVAFDMPKPVVEEIEPVGVDTEIVEDQAVELAGAPAMEVVESEKEIANNADVIVAAPTAPAGEVKREAEVLAKAKKNQISSMSIDSRNQGKDMDDSLAKQVLNGTVSEISTGETLIGASVLIKDSYDGVTTDFDGNFTLESSQPLPWTIVVSYTGYSNQEIVINKIEDPIVISLDNEGLALEEVVVTGYGSRKEKKSKSDAIQNPEPRSSFKKLERYIKKNLNYPEIARNNKLEGNVTVRFYINANGEPEQLSVLKSLGSGCDEEAMRLIEEGPKWKPANTWATYLVKFEL